ncbi:MAG: aspartate aminotransferase family protein [Alphaproteobacteria bacterium]
MALKTQAAQTQVVAALEDTAAPSPIRATYLKRTQASAEAHARAKRVMPGGTSRQAGYWAPYPLTIERAEGVQLWDVDGSRYIDLINNYTAMVHGHAYPAIVEATARQLPRGTGWSAGNVPQSDLAARIVARVPSVDQLRFTNSGTEASALAFTVARIVTGRSKLLMARYGYHGSLLEFETGSFGRAGPLTHLARFNDLSDFEAVLAEHGHEIAAVFLEPVLGSGGVVAASRDFLHGAKAAAHKAGALFVLDEVLTFRFAVGGWQAAIDLDPDLTMFGKLIGGGFPVGAVGGRKDLMRIFDPADMKVFHTGTFNANPVTMTAGAVSVRELTADRIAAMEVLCGVLKEGLARAAERAGLPLSINHVGSCLNLYFSTAAPESSIVRDDAESVGKFHLAAMNQGLFLAPRGMIALSTVLTRAHVDETVERAEAAMRDVAAEIG